MEKEELIEYFKSQMKGDPNMASAVAAIQTLLEFLKRDKGETIQGLRANLTSAIETLCGVDSSVAVSSGGELFLRFISLTSLEYSVSPALPLFWLSADTVSCTGISFLSSFCSFLPRITPNVRRS